MEGAGEGQGEVPCERRAMRHSKCLPVITQAMGRREKPSNALPPHVWLHQHHMAHAQRAKASRRAQRPPSGLARANAHSAHKARGATAMQQQQRGGGRGWHERAQQRIAFRPLTGLAVLAILTVSWRGCWWVAVEAWGGSECGVCVSEKSKQRGCV